MKAFSRTCGGDKCRHRIFKLYLLEHVFFEDADRN